MCLSEVGGNLLSRECEETTPEKYHSGPTMLEGVVDISWKASQVRLPNLCGCLGSGSIGATSFVNHHPPATYSTVSWYTKPHLGSQLPSAGILGYHFACNPKFLTNQIPSSSSLVLPVNDQPLNSTKQSLSFLQNNVDYRQIDPAVSRGQHRRRPGQALKRHGSNVLPRASIGLHPFASPYTAPAPGTGASMSSNMRFCSKLKVKPPRRKPLAEPTMMLDSSAVPTASNKFNC